MFAKRTDNNHKEIVNALRKLGFSVFDTSGIGKGFPDLVAGKHQKTILIEIKSSNKAPFTEHQKDFMLNWKGSTVVRIHDLEGIQTLIKILDNLQ